MLKENIVHVYVLEDSKYALADIYESGAISGGPFPELTIRYERSLHDAA